MADHYLTLVSPGDAFLSLVIPHHYAQSGKREVLERCLASVRGHYDELIVVANDGIGVCAALNIGMHAASGEFIIIMNDDVILDKGDFVSLCREGVVTHPLFDGEAKQFGSCVCYPRRVYERLCFNNFCDGPYDETYKFGYYEDNDIFYRCDRFDIPRRVDPSVNLLHPHPGRTLGQLDKGDFGGANRANFIDKWGKTPEEVWVPPTLIHD